VWGGGGGGLLVVGVATKHPGEPRTAVARTLQDMPWVPTSTQTPTPTEATPARMPRGRVCRGDLDSCVADLGDIGDLYL
jgi:hypothetical protein